MKMKLSAVLVALWLVPSVTLAQDFDAGLRAAQAGDFETALKEWRPLAEQGNAGAQVNLGKMYAEGLGIPQDYAEAVKWYRLAAEQGISQAQKNLGARYDNGEGVPQDYAEAAKWYRLAAEQGNAAAQNNLGVMYEYGHGLPQDYTTAHMWFNLASANGDNDSGKYRDELAKQMTPQDISEAQRRARVCMESDYQDCD
jgi:TPR repeat protein